VSGRKFFPPAFFFGKGGAVKVMVIFIFLAAVVFGGSLDAWLPREAVVRHERYALSFDAARRVPRWVCWRIEPSTGKVSRAGMGFEPDPGAPLSPAPSEYAGSGFDLGHMCPAADMASDVESLRLTFLTSNVAPQLPALNRGDWRELEAALRAEAASNAVVCVCGPVWVSATPATIGAGVAVPDAFFKVAWGGTCGVARAWVMPNRSGNRRPSDYAVPVEAVERATGLTFLR